VMAYPWSTSSDLPTFGRNSQTSISMMGLMIRSLGSLPLTAHTSRPRHTRCTLRDSPALSCPPRCENLGPPPNARSLLVLCSKIECERWI
jgi:hypothetical protein